MKKLKILGVLLGAIMILSGCGDNDSDVAKTSEDKINVVTSFYAMKSLTEEIGGDKINVINIIDEGTEPHDFEPKAKDLKSIEESDIFVYNGAGMEEWIEDVEGIIANKELTTVEASKGVELISTTEEDEDHDHEGKNEADDHDHSHLGNDPHTWLGLSEAKIQGENIKNALVEKDEKNGSYYEENYKVFAQKIDELIESYKSKFEGLTNKNFVTGHATFAYLCRDLSLEQRSIEGVFAEGEPSPKELETLIQYCKDNNIKVIFVEELVSPALSETLAREVQGVTKQIYTLHSGEDGMSFSDTLKYNVETIYDTLE